MALPTLTRSRTVADAPPALPPLSRDDPHVRKLTGQLADLEKEAAKLEAAIAAATDRLAAAAATIPGIEVDALVGDADARALERAKAAVAKAQTELAEARVRLEANGVERARMREALTIVRDRAKEARCRAGWPAHRENIRHIAEALALAREFAEADVILWTQQVEEFGFMGSKSARGVSFPSAGGLIALDLGNMLGLPGDVLVSGNRDPNVSWYSRFVAEVERDAFVVESSFAPAAPPKASPRLPEPYRRLTYETDEATPHKRFTPNVDRPDDPDLAAERALGISNWEK